MIQIQLAIAVAYGWTHTNCSHWPQMLGRTVVKPVNCTPLLIRAKRDGSGARLSHFWHQISMEVQIAVAVSAGSVAGHPRFESEVRKNGLKG
jgi:hypothetical protein